jgi:heme exporter protein B
MRRVLALVWKDLLVEFRGREFVGAMLVFALVTIVTLNFAFDLANEGREASGAGALWIAFLFAGMLGLGRSIAVERDRGTLEALLLCPVAGGTLFLGKFAANVIFIGLVEIISLPVFYALYDLPALAPMVVLIALAGTVGFAGLGTLFSALASSSRAREILLPLLLLPLSIPVVIAVVRATTLVFQDDTADAWRWFNLLVAFDIVFVTLAYLVFDVALED